MSPEHWCNLWTGEKACATKAVHLIQLRVDRHHSTNDACRAQGVQQRHFCWSMLDECSRILETLSCTVQDDSRHISAFRPAETRQASRNTHFLFLHLSHSCALCTLHGVNGLGPVSLWHTCIYMFLFTLRAAVEWLGQQWRFECTWVATCWHSQTVSLD